MSHVRLLRRYSGYLYALPYLLLFGMFIVLPLLYGLGLSLFRWEMLSRLGPRFIGLGNYVEAVHDPYFWKALGATFKFVAMAVPITVCIALLIAVGLKSLCGRRQAFYRAAYFVPTILTISVAGILWRWFYNSEFGLFNAYLGRIGLKIPCSLVQYIYETAFNNYRMGYAAALSWLLFLVIAVFSLAQFRLMRER